MKRLKEFCLVILVPIFALICMCSPASAEDCIATVSPDLKLHIPAVVFDTGVYFVDLQYTPSDDGIVWFDLVGAGVVDQLQCENTAILFPVSGTYSVYVPTVAVGTDQYWVSLEFVPDTAATAVAQTNRVAGSKLLKAKATGAGKKGTNPPGRDRFPVKAVFEDTISLEWGGEGDLFVWKISVKAVVPLGVPLWSLTQPQDLTYGPSIGDIQVVGTQCICQIPPPNTCNCKFNIEGKGTFYVNDLQISNINSSDPTITMKYFWLFPPPMINIVETWCDKYGRCNKDPRGDVSALFSGIPLGFYWWGHQSEADVCFDGLPCFVATDWTFVEHAAIELPYAFKKYGPISVMCMDGGPRLCKLNTSISLLEW